MSTILLRIERPQSTPADARLRLYIGTEDAASLAASTPAGGTLALEVPVYGSSAEHGGYGTAAHGEKLYALEGGMGHGMGEHGYQWFGLNDLPRASLSKDYQPADISIDLPVGVAIVDAAGNQSSISEDLLSLDIAPQPVAGLTAAATANTGEVLLSWTASTSF